MLTSEQEKWINHLSDDSKIKIVPFDPTSQEKFEKIKSIIQAKLGESIKVEHHGASRFGISGQDEIDIYVPVSERQFDEYLEPLTELFGKPRSHYPLERARFITTIEEKHIDVFLINETGGGWLECLMFEERLKSEPTILDKYRKLKENGNGLSVREYYRNKIEFINSVLGK